MLHQPLIFFQLLLLIFSNFLISSQDLEITPYKFTDSEYTGKKTYSIPPSSRFLVKRTDLKAPNIVFYFTKPQALTYPIAIVCGGSTSKDDIESIIHFHRYVLKEFLDLNIGVVTVEQWGVDGDHIHKKEFLDHYTRTQRLKDYHNVIDYLKDHPPHGWNGKLIFLGVSEGGLLVTSLTGDYSDITLATLNWSGAGDWQWREELWAFVQKLKCDHAQDVKDCPGCTKEFRSRKSYDHTMDKTLQNPASDLFFLGVTYLYHADAQTYPIQNYQKLKTPFLIVAGDQDTLIHSSDAFVEKAKEAGTPITYYRVENMNHYIRKRPDIIGKSFAWLKDQID